MSQREYVGIDLHRRRSVIVRVDEQGQHLSTVRVPNDPVEVITAVAAAGPSPEVVVEATYGWYWLVDLLQEHGCRVHLASPSQLNWGNRQVKNDERDALDLVRKLRLGELPEAWIAPPAIRELRELVRYRAKAVQLRSGLKAQVHGVMGKEGVLPGLGDMFGPGGQKLLDTMSLSDNYRTRVESLRDVIELYDREITMLDRQIHGQLKDDPGYRAIQTLPGVGRVIAGIMVAEIGDVTRFSSPEKLCSWAGLTPKHFESDTKVVRGRVTKQGSKLLRWAASRRSRPSTAVPASKATTTASPSDGGRTRPGSPWPVVCSRWCSTACETGPSGPCRPAQTPREPSRHRPDAVRGTAWPPRREPGMCLNPSGRGRIPQCDESPRRDARQRDRCPPSHRPRGEPGAKNYR